MAKKEMVVVEGDKYCLYKQRNTLSKDKVNFIAKQPEFKGHTKEQIAEAWLHEQSERPILISGIASDPLANKIFQFLRANPVKNYEMHGRPELIPLYQEAKLKIHKLISTMGPEVTAQNKKIVRIIQAGLTDDQDLCTSKDLWRVFNLWLLRNFYPGTDKEVVQKFIEKMGKSNKNYDTVENEWGLLDVMGFNDHMEYRTMLELIIEQATA